MDAIDKNILFEFLLNSRVTYQELSTKYGLSANGIKKRVNIMREKGILKDFYVELSLSMIGVEMSLALVVTDGTEDKQAFINLLGNDERVNTVGYTSGSMYMVFAVYKNGSNGLFELNSFYRQHNFVKSVEIHPILYNMGEKVDELSHVELLILKELVKYPRMSFSEISKVTSISSSIVSSTIKSMSDNGVIHFGAHFNPNAGDWITFVVKIMYTGELNSLLDWVAKTFPEEFFTPAGLPVTEPIAFLAFIVNELSMASNISNKIKEHASVTSVMTILGEPSFSFPDYRIIELKRKVENV